MKDFLQWMILTSILFWVLRVCRRPTKAQVSKFITRIERRRKAKTA